MNHTYSRIHEMYLFEYSSVAQFVEIANAAKEHAERRKAENVASILNTIETAENGGADWLGLPLPEMIAAVAHGWQDGVDRLMAALGDLQTDRRAVCQKRRRTRGDTGDSVDMQAIYAGRSDTAWTRCTRIATAGTRRVRLVASLAGSGGASTEDFFWRGAACIRLADILTEAGYAVEIFADYTLLRGFAQDQNAKLVQRIKIKDACAPIEPASLAACLALAGFKRYYGFLAAAWCCSDLKLQQSKNIGTSVEAVSLEPGEITGFAAIASQDDARLFVQDALDRLALTNN